MRSEASLWNLNNMNLHLVHYANEVCSFSFMILNLKLLIVVHKILIKSTSGLLRSSVHLRNVI